jgi:heme exporter protein B
MLKAAWFIFYTELILLLRHSQEWLYPLAFFVIVLSLFPLAITPDPALLIKIMPGCIWIAALLANLLSIQPLFFIDMEEGYLEQCLLSQIPLHLFMLAKLSAQWLVSTLPLILLIPFLSSAFHLSVSASIVLCCTLLLGTPIVTLIGSLGAALTLGLRQQGALLGLIILPLNVPVLIFSVMIVQQSQAGLSIASPLAFLAGLSLLAITLLPWTIAVTLRISLDD